MKKLFLTCAALLTSFTLFAEEAAPATPERGQSMWQTLILLAVAIVFFYFILWRPEQKRRKNLEKQRAAMKKGDRVTAMGIVGTLIKIQEKTAIVKMYDGSKIEILLQAITDVQPGGEEEVKVELNPSSPRQSD